ARRALPGEWLHAQPAANAAGVGPPGSAGDYRAVRDRSGDPLDAQPGRPVQSGSCSRARHRTGDRQPALRPSSAAAAQRPDGSRAAGVAIMSDAARTKSTSMDALVGQIADEFTQRLNQGDQPDVEDFARRYPEIADVLREVLAALQFVRIASPELEVSNS